MSRNKSVTVQVMQTRAAGIRLFAAARNPLTKSFHYMDVTDFSLEELDSIRDYQVLWSHPKCQVIQLSGFEYCLRRVRFLMEKYTSHKFLREDEVRF